MFCCARMDPKVLHNPERIDHLTLLQEHSSPPTRLKGALLIRRSGHSAGHCAPGDTLIMAASTRELLTKAVA